MTSPTNEPSDADHLENATARQSITRMILACVLGVSFFTILALGGGWMFDRYRCFEHEADVMRAEYIQDQKEIIRLQVERMADYINYMKKRPLEVLKRITRQYASEARSIASAIHESNKGVHTDAEIKEMIKVALNPVRHETGRGNVFIIDLNGTSQLHPPLPEYENASMLGIRDDAGRPVVREMLAFVQAEGEGFFEYKWVRPGSGNVFAHREISFVTALPELGWMIGADEYLDDVENSLRKETLERIEQSRFDEDGYFFVGSFNGTALTAPAKGRHVWNATDVNGVKIVQELIRAAKNGGGFVQYVMPHLQGNSSVSKISYALAVPDWGWYVAAGVYTDKIEALVKDRRDKLKRDLMRDLGFIFVILLTAGILAAHMARRAARRCQANFLSLTRFFKEATSGSPQLDLDGFNIKEVQDLAGSANAMVRERDTTEKENLRLRRSLKNLIDSMPSAIISLDMDSRVMQFNSAASIYLAMPGHHAEGEPASEAFPILAQHAPVISHVLQTGEVQRVSDLATRLSESPRRIEIEISPLADDSTDGVVVRLDDVTNRVRMEEAMIQAEKMASVGGLAAGMAHEINNPLGIIVQSAQSIERRLSPDLPANLEAARSVGADLDTVRRYLEQRNIFAYVEGVRDAGARAADIVRSMLEFSRKSESRRAPSRLGEIVTAALALASNDYDLKEKFDFRRIKIVREDDPSLGQVSCTNTEIEQVLLNLLKNAAQAFKSQPDNPDPTIRIITRREDDLARIEVADNGPGMSKETSRKIFEPFFTTKAPGMGTGLGLSVSYFIVTRNHGGRFHVESEPGKGSRFIIHLPLDPVC